MGEVVNESVTGQFENVEINLDDERDNIDAENSKEPILEDVTTNQVTGDYFIDISVSEPQKVGDGMGSYLAYKITTHTNMPKFSKNQFSTMRRFSDFLRLHSILVGKHIRNGRIIPPVPEKNLIGSTKVKMSQPPPESGNGLQVEWLETRRAALERFLNRVAQHQVLRTEPEFISFLEIEQELPKAVDTAALSGAAVMRLFNKVGETVNKITYKMDENDPWFDDKISEIETEDTHMQNLHSAIKTLVQYRKELANLTGIVAKSAAMLSTCEDHTSLSRALSQLADVQEKVELLRTEQANSDFYILSEILKDYTGLLGAVKAVFHERVKVFQNWQHAQLQLTKRRENKAKLELSDKIDKLGQAQKEVTEWEAKVQRCQKEFDDISVEIKKEIERFEENKTQELKATIIKYLEDQMAHQQQLVKYWEAFTPSAKEIV